MAFALLQPSKHDVYPFINPRGHLNGAAAGKTVLVTGAGTGIGRGIAESFALAGATSLILAARRTEPLEATKASIATLAPECQVTAVGGADIADQASVEALFANLHEAPDVVVSNAAVSGAAASVADSDPTAWWRTMDINLRGTYLIARTYIQHLRAAGKKQGRIINVSSNNAWRYISGLSSYAASKLALNSLTEYIDREELAAGSGVRCVAMHPGGVAETGMTGVDIPEHIRRMLIDKPELAGGTAVYLSTERADFLMGRFVSATWCMEDLEKAKERVESEDLLKPRVIGVA